MAAETNYLELYPRVHTVTNVETIITQSIFSIDGNGSLNERRSAPIIASNSIAEIKRAHGETLQLSIDQIDPMDMIVRYYMKEVLYAGPDTNPDLISAFGARAMMQFLVAQHTPYASELTLDRMILRAPERYMTPRLTGIFKLLETQQAREVGGDQLVRLKEFADKSTI